MDLYLRGYSTKKWLYVLYLGWVRLVGINIQSDLNAIDSQVWGLLCY